MDALSLGLTVFTEGPDFVKNFLLLCITFGSSKYNSFSAVIMDLVALRYQPPLKIAIFPYLRFQRFQIGLLESFL